MGIWKEYVKLGRMDQGGEKESERAQMQKSHREFGTGLGRDSMKHEGTGC